MRTFHDAKVMARTLRERLAGKQVSLTHSECLELVAQQFGLPDWNILSARIARDPAGFDSAVPMIRIFDAAKAREFYIGFLGFEFDWIDESEWKRGSTPLYTQISRGALVLHLTEHHGDASPGANVHVTVGDVDALRRELDAKDYAYGKPGIEEVPWGRRLQVHDPFGNRLTFVEPKRERQ